MAGLPNVQTIDGYGGVKSDYAPVVDPKTTQSAAEHNSLVADVAMLTRMAPRAMVRFFGDTVPGFASVGTAHESMWGRALAVRPTLTRTFTGIFKVSWPLTVVNELGESVPPNFRWATCWAEGGTAFTPQAVVTSTNEIMLSIYNSASGALADPNASGITFGILAY